MVLCHVQILRIVDSLQLTTERLVATPVNWEPGHDVMVRPNVSHEEAKAKVTLHTELLHFQQHL